MSVEEFWSLSVGEIVDYLEAYERRERQRRKRELENLHFLSQDIFQHMTRLVNGGNEKLLELWDFFPELFREEKEVADKDEKDKIVAVYKAQMQDFAYRHNHKRAREGGEE